MQPTRVNNITPDIDILAVALELSSAAWKIGLHDGKREKPTIQTVSANTAACRLEQAVREIEETKERWALAPDVRTVVLYEAGQDGFWIARALSKLGYESLICDPSGIPVERHARRAKTDRLDAIRLVMCLRAWLHGAFDRMHLIRVPSVEAEAQRHLIRDHERNSSHRIKLRTRCTNRTDFAQTKWRASIPERCQRRIISRCEPMILPPMLTRQNESGAIIQARRSPSMRAQKPKASWRGSTEARANPR